ncbi:DNA polymerase I [Ghiorsea bivora]|uniref:DNA polymerase I n=1 Tax=Ghiorsea bivora TaxID=1485545 RepID=UPI000570BFB9|nr:DNA polymerase I [Ghiorsea bivora]
MPHLVLIDGPNYVFRAFHAVKHNLSNSKGQPTNAVFGYVQMVRSILKDLSPTHVAVVFDPKGGTFRNDMYKEYKAHRPPMPEDLAAQWNYIYEVTDAFNFARICVQNYEADDVIATLARQAEAKGWDVTIVSTDKDLMQLVGDKIWMLDTMRRKEYGIDEVKEKWGVEPAKVQDLLALAGDSADNIPGVPGIGPKTALELINTYGDLEGILSHAHEIKQNKRRENLIEFADDARLSYDLVALDEQTPLPLTLDDLKVQKPNREALVKVFAELEFRRLTAEFLDGDEVVTPSVIASPDSEHNEVEEVFAEQKPLTTIIVDDKAKLADLVNVLNAADLIAVDTETTSLNIHDADLVGLSFSVKAGVGYYVPVAHRGMDLLSEAPKQLDKKSVFSALKPILEDKNKAKCLQNNKYDKQILRNEGITLQGVKFDTMLMAYVLEAGQAVNMDKLALKYLGHECVSFESIAGKGVKQITFDLIGIEEAAKYAAEDAEVTLRLCHKFQDKLGEHIKRHDDIELPLSFVLADMEWDGAYIDVAQLHTLSTKFGERIDALQTKIFAAAGQEFNIQSPKQLGVLLFETLGIEGGKKTKSGQWATGQEVLEKLAAEHEVPRLILEVRSLSKLKSTYTDALQKMINKKTGRVHTSYNQAVTTTGRLSSTNPNLQNIPIRSEEGREIRKAFVAEAGNQLIAADYSQIELRLMAHFSGDANLKQAFADGLDIHAATAASVNQIPLEEVTGEQRRQAKAVNFGILYGMSAFGLAKQLGVSRGDAKAFIEAYFAQYPTVQTFMDSTLEKARVQGYVETLLGHRVQVPDINSSNGMQKAYAERTAINAPLQGSAADIIKVAMIQLQMKLNELFPQARLIMQVHDELIVECSETDVEQVSALIKEVMEAAVTLDVPLIADIGIGTSWFESHQL